jgi:uncharacterized protein (DUF3084 family)
MTRVLVQFLTGYSRYNKGETAGFDKAKAEQLCSGKAPVARLVGPVKQVAVIGSIVTKDIDSLDREHQELALAGDNLANQLAGLEQREQDLESREAALAEGAQDLAVRVADLLQRERALEAGGEPIEQVDSDPGPKEKAPGAPPKQGTKA